MSHPASGSTYRCKGKVEHRSHLQRHIVRKVEKQENWDEMIRKLWSGQRGVVVIELLVVAGLILTLASPCRWW